MQMKYKYIILLVLVSLITNCKKSKNVLNVNATIIKYNLDLDTGHYDLKYSSWNRDGQIYINKETDSCLIILKNKKGDTILTHFDKGIDPWFNAKMIKIDRECFIIKRYYEPLELDSTVTDYIPLDKAKGDYSYDNIDLPMDIYYILDSVNKKLKPVKPVSRKEVLKKINAKFHFKENIKILASTNKYTYIAKDTIEDSQVYYRINTIYVPQKNNTEWALIPTVFSGLANVNKLGVYKNNFTIHTESLVNSFFDIPNDNLRQKAGSYSINLKYYLKFSCDTKINKRCENEFVKLEVVIRNETEKSDKVIETFTNDSFFENQPFNLFKYRYGDYFIGVLPETIEQYKESIFRLDTINWKLNQVKSFNKKTDLKFTHYRKNNKPIISEEMPDDMSSFLMKFEIVKVGDNYKLMARDHD